MNYQDFIPRIEDLPHAPKRIIMHWTGGKHIPNSVDLEHYHFLFDGDGDVVKGVHPVSSNMRRLKSGDNYAAHTRGFNSYSIGVSFCGMHGSRPGVSFGNWPLKENQVQEGLKFVSALCLAYGLNPMDSHHVFTHYEAEYLHGVDQVPVGPGTWKRDITELEFLPDLKKNDVGSWIRSQVRKHEDDLLPRTDICLALPQPSPLDLLWEREVVSYFGPEDPTDLREYIP